MRNQLHSEFVKQPASKLREPVFDPTPRLPGQQLSFVSFFAFFNRTFNSIKAAQGKSC